jgi:uncharacterized membrane protein YbhN (UPF0104 family)
MPLIGIIFCTLIVQMLMPLLWYASLRASGSHLELPTVYKTFYKTNILKFLPGFLWNQPGRALQAQKYGVSLGTFTQSAIYELTFTFIPAAILCGIGLSVTFHSSAWYILSGIAFLGALLFIFFPEKWLPFQKQITLLPVRQRFPWCVFLLVVSFSVWGFYASSVYLGVFLLEPARLPSWIIFTALNTTAWVAGFLSPAPAGLGVRELGLSTLLGPSIGDIAVVASLFQRAVEMVGEVLLWAGATWVFKKGE